MEKYKCIECRKRSGKKYFKFKCWQCYLKTHHLIGMGPQRIETAIKKHRIVLPYGERLSRGVIYVPKSLIGKKIKLVLLDK